MGQAQLTVQEGRPPSGVTGCGAGITAVPAAGADGTEAEGLRFLGPPSVAPARSRERTASGGLQRVPEFVE